MNLPEQPTFRPAPQEDQPWSWRLEDASGSEVTLPADLVDEYAGKTFPSQADAESWIGEVWPDLSDAGVAAVTLFDVDRLVYGPMSLSA